MSFSFCAIYCTLSWISTGHAVGLRSKHREECTGKTAQCCHGKDELKSKTDAWEAV